MLVRVSSRLGRWLTLATEDSTMDADQLGFSHSTAPQAQHAASPCWTAEEPNVTTKRNELRGLSPPANYTDRAIAPCQRS
jgi:hypothetical protein